MYYLYLIDSEFHLYDKIQPQLLNFHYFIIPFHYTNIIITIEKLNDSYHLFISYFNYKLSISEFISDNIQYFINKEFTPINKIIPNNLFLNFLEIGRGY